MENPASGWRFIANTIPVDAAKRENPVEPTEESLARGKKQYGYDCAMCHGKNVDGKGDVAADMKLAMNDKTNPSLLKNRTDGELFYIIQKGKDQMPPEGTRVKGVAIWDMVNYVRLLAKEDGRGTCSRQRAQLASSRTSRTTPERSRAEEDRNFVAPLDGRTHDNHFSPSAQLSSTGCTPRVCRASLWPASYLVC